MVQFLSLTVMAATPKSIKGVVVDETGEPLIGATVQVEGTSTGVSSDLEGNFVINASDGQVLMFSYLGYKPQKIKVTPSTNNITVKMEMNSEVLDDVVVIGSGAMKKKDLTGV